MPNRDRTGGRLGVYVPIPNEPIEEETTTKGILDKK